MVFIKRFLLKQKEQLYLEDESLNTEADVDLGLLQHSIWSAF